MHALFSPPLSSETIDKLQTILSTLLTAAEGHSSFQKDRFTQPNRCRADRSKSERTVKQAERNHLGLSEQLHSVPLRSI